MTTINKTRTLRKFLLTWGFKSLWIQCFSWSACNPKATNPKDSNNQTKILHRETEQTNKNRSLPNCLIKCLATGSDTLPWRLMYSARSPPLQYSNTRKILSPVYKDHKKSSKVHTFINKTQKEDESKPNLDGFVESDDVGMIDGSEDRNLLEETVSDFRVKLLLINLLDCDF